MQIQYDENTINNFCKSIIHKFTFIFLSYYDFIVNK
jgi:hypothetical protein